MNTAPYQSLLSFAHSLADISGEVIRSHYRNLHKVEEKADHSPVTVADKEAETAIRKAITHHHPTHGIMGEEYGYDTHESDYQWIIDPIDGTKSFMVGRPIFGTLIALVHHAIPIIGIIDQPITGDRWAASDKETLFNGRPAKTRICHDLSEAVIATTGPDYFTTKERTLFQRIEKQCKFAVFGGDCYNYGLVASGLIDVVIESGLKPHDYMALAAVVKAAGGIFTDWEGKEVTLASDGKVVAAGSAVLHQKILSLIHGN